MEVALRLLAIIGDEIDPCAWAFASSLPSRARADCFPTPVTRGAVCRGARRCGRREDTARSCAASGATSEMPTTGCSRRPLACFAAPELGALAKRGLVRPTLTLIEALIRDDVETCARLVEQANQPMFGGGARLIAEAAGLDPVDTRRFPWREWTEAVGDADEAGWRALAIRRLARNDLDHALALEALHAGEAAVMSPRRSPLPSRSRATIPHGCARLSEPPIVDDAAGSPVRCTRGLPVSTP